MKSIRNAQELGYVLTAGVEEAYISSSHYLKFIQVVAKRIGVRFEDTKLFLSSEIVSALRKEGTLSKNTLNERKKGFILATLQGQQYLSTGRDGHTLSQWVDRELNKTDLSITQFSGQIACKGFVRGKVKVALLPAQAKTIKAGEILVCPMTNPSYVPAMKLCGAIITDEGGLLSHAAIMSREFNKPCVIGTKIATKVLKDGDLVEVDANEGIVRKIK
jgi:pyruvate,water dikinase